MNDAIKSTFSVLPDQASSIAGPIDLLYLFIAVVSVVFTVLAAFLVVYFAIRYRRRSDDEVPAPPHADNRLEIVGSVFLLVLLMVMFGWGAKLFFKSRRPPSDAIEILVTGKQWMWKIQHPQGKREINELHVPINTPVRLTMSSEDVIHSFFVPAFRVKQDVVPGRYTYLWFEPTRLGKYHLFCTEYCGTSHSAMRGTVYVMSAKDYQEWLKGSVTAAASGAISMAELGLQAFKDFGCVACHTPVSGALGPDLAGVLGKKRVFQDGTELVADENYLRESILTSQARLLEGYQPVMPLFKGLINEEQLANLIAYIKSLSNPADTGDNG